MVKSPHEAHHRVFQEIPQFFRRAFDLLGLPDPGQAEVSVLNCDVTEFQPVERRVDTLLELKCSDGHTYLLVVEAQSEKDPDKAVSWAYYLSFLATKYKKHSPVLLVVCREKKTADWAAGPFKLGFAGQPNLVVSPFVLGPDNVPRITDIDRAAADLPLAVFSAVTHGSDDHVGEILEALAGALKQAPKAVNTLYAELTASGLGNNTRATEIWRELMGTGLFDQTSWVAEGFRDQGRAQGREQGREQGRRQERARSILRVLESREVSLPDDARERITACEDDEQLDRWFDRALTATTIEAVLEEPGED